MTTLRTKTQPHTTHARAPTTTNTPTRAQLLTCVVWSQLAWSDTEPCVILARGIGYCVASVPAHMPTAYRGLVGRHCASGETAQVISYRVFEALGIRVSSRETLLWLN